MMAIASIPFVTVLYPYHPRVRGAYVVALPLTVGYILGLATPAWSRKRAAHIMAACAAVLSPGVALRRETALPPLATFVVAASGIGLTVLFLRLGLAHAGLGWSGRPTPDDDRPTRPVAFVSLGAAWLLLAWVMFQPAETSPVTRLLLLALGSKPPANAAGPLRVELRRYALSAAALPRESGPVQTGGYRFSVGILRARPGEMLVNASVRRTDGRAFGFPAWLTLGVDDPARPNPSGDDGFLDRGYLLRSDPGRDAVLASADARNLSAAAFLGLSRSVASVRIRARVWRLQGVRADGTAVFRPVAEADLGSWDLTVLRYLRRQPYRRGLNPGAALPQR